MTQTHIIDGKALAETLRYSLKTRIASLPSPPGLAVLLVGDDPASHVYVKNKIAACQALGIKSFESRLPQKATQAEVAAEIKAFNANPAVHGILLQLPVPHHLDSGALIQMIDPKKDVDGLTLPNIGALVAGLDGLVPCTPQGALLLIQSVKTDLEGLNALVIGRSLLFGKPMAQLLLTQNCTVTTAHSRTKNLPDLCAQADIVISAIGQPRMVKGAWLKRGAIVIDVGINRLENGTLCGDVDYNSALGIAGALTPVPGGVGPMTIACLLQNTVRAAENLEHAPAHKTDY